MLNSSKIPQTRLSKGMTDACFSMLDGALEPAISVLDKNFAYVYINEATYKKFGLTQDELGVGDDLQKCHDLLITKGLLTPETIERNRLSMSARAAQGGNKRSSYIMELADGRKLQLERILLDNGYTVSVSTDVSKHIERDILLEDALELGESGYWTYDVKTKATFLSHSIENHVSKDVLKAVKRDGVQALAVSEDRHLLPKAIKEALAGDGKFKFSSRLSNHHGKESRTVTSGEILRDLQGKPKRIRAFVKDTTSEYKQAQALKKAKDEAVSASIAKSEFLANMSHEIRTPMNGILGMAELLGNSNIDGRQKDFVKVINNSAKALLTIINDILDFSKIEAGKLELDPMPFDLRESVFDVSALMQTAASEKGLEMTVNYAPDLPRNFVGDAGRIRQILTNLVSNAVKFTDVGHIDIAVSATPAPNNMSILKMSVSDTGIGIAPEKMGDVFRKFTQADGSTTRLYGGTGLGLSITKHLIEIMKGRIKVQSDVGRGSVFTVAIPLPIDQDAVPDTYKSEALSSRRILVVDDLAINREILSEQLRSWDVDPVVAKDAAQALKLLTGSTPASKFDMVLLDYLMPDVDGLALAQTITDRADIAPVPLVMLTSYDVPMTRDVLAERGILDCLTKPIREKNLYDRLTHHLNTMPRLRESEPASAAEVSGEDAAAEEAIEVLVAEDFALNQDVVRLMLSESKFKPVFADNGQIAVDKYIAEPSRFKAILMDVSMPVKDGYQASQDILAYEADIGLDHTPIIALTGHALKHDREKCLSMGMDEYLTKPVKQDQLIHMLIKKTENLPAQQKVA